MVDPRRDSSRFDGRCTSTRIMLCMVAVLAMGAADAQEQGGGAREPTRSTNSGPEYRATPDSRSASSARLWQDGDPGQPLDLRGRILSTDGKPVSGAIITLWQADGGGQYHPERYRAQLVSATNGEFRLATAVPGQYYGVKHIHLTVSHDQYRPLTTRILFKGDPNLSESDADLAILLEEVRAQDRVLMVGSVELVLEPL
ncbi:MAG: hypothetical protein KDK91_18895 [Gammaproteobacteria bacterium]|nr:hypothetical protein [Gammaproteobacteria bacterium]